MTEEKEHRKSGEDFKAMYKETTDLIRQIEVSTGRCTKLEDVFSSELLSLRFQFRERCEKLICGSPQHFGRVVREKLWRYAFYDVIGRSRRYVKDKVWESLPKAYITQHLYHGVGYLSMLLMKLEEGQDFRRSKFPFPPNAVDSIFAQGFAVIKSDEAEALEEPPKWLNDLLYIIHINIGDLYRYLTDVHSKDELSSVQSEDYFSRAKEYYSQAFILYPDSGLAMNQIGNLSVKVNFGVDTTYYMLHSMLSSIPYEGAAPNLRNHLSSCLVHFATLPATHESKPIEIFCNSFLTQIHNFLYENMSMTNFGKNISDVIVNFQERLATYDPDLDDRFLFRISCICVLTFWQLQGQNSPNISLSVAFATAMFSQILTRVGTILEQHSHVKELIKKKCLSPPPLELLEDNELDEEQDTLSKEDEANVTLEFAALKIEESTVGQKVVINGAKAKHQSVLRRRRRRRVFKNMIPSSSTDESDSVEEHFEGEESGNEDSDDSNLSWSDSDSDDFSESDCTEDRSSAVDELKQNGTNENRNRAFPSYSSSNSRSDTSANSYRSQKNEVIKSRDKTDSGKVSETSNASGKDGCIESNGITEVETSGDHFAVGLSDLEKCRAQLEPLLVALSPFIRWIEISPGIKDAFAANCGKDYVSSLCNMFNLLLSENWGDVLDGLNEDLKQEWESLSETTAYDAQLFKWQLPEDRSLMGLPHVEAWIKSLDSEKTFHGNELILIRMARIISFGHWLVQTKCFWIAYDGDPKQFKYQSPRAKTPGGGNEKIKRLMDLDPGSDALTRAYKAGERVEPSTRRNRRGRNDTRRRAGRGRNEVGTTKDAASVIFIVVDLPAVLHYLRNLQKLANKRRFVVVFPRPVWKAVDEMKEARGSDAIDAQKASEWIKMCTVKGHRGVRCLRDHEKMPLDCDYPKNMEKQSKEFFLMMETCKYLLAHDGYDKSASRTFFGDMRDKFRVMYLSGYDDILSKDSSDFNPIGVARMVGTFVDLVSGYPPQSKRRKWRKSKSNG